jgi:calcineurin-like phosphoesterase family protein
MDEIIIQNFNAVIKPQDKVYHLGDVCFRSVERLHKIMPRLMGKWRLLLGNHDHYKIEEYAKYFKIEPCWKNFKDQPKPFVCTHVPVHENVLLEGRFKHDIDRGQVYNVHGHLHGNLVCVPDTKKPDPRYISVCLEHTDYKPVHLDELLTRMKT